MTTSTATATATATATYSCSWPSGIGYIPSSSACGPINSTDPIVPCCADGDYCLTDNICAYTSHSDDGGSGYYSAGCTNSTFINDGSNSACSDRCADTGLPDIVYDSSDGSWKCCGGTEAERNCSDPTNETFVGSAPSDLITIWLAGETVAPTSSSSSTSTSASTTSTSLSTSSITSAASTIATIPMSSTTTPTPTSRSSTGNSSDLSTGAKAGIGVGAGVLFLALLTAISIYVRHRRKRIIENKNRMQIETKGYPGYPVFASELDPTPVPQELPLSTKPLAELY